MTVTKPHWGILVDEKTRHKTSIFYDNKSDQIEPICVKIHKWNDSGIPVKYFRCDNAVENK